MLGFSVRIPGGLKLGERASVPEILFDPLLRMRTAVPRPFFFLLIIALTTIHFSLQSPSDPNLCISSDLFSPVLFSSLLNNESQ